MLRNRAEITLAADAEGTGADFFSRGLTSTCVVSGNFDLRVSYRLLNWPNGNGVRAALFLGDDAAHTLGQLRVVGDGSIVTGYYRHGASWVSLSSIDLGTPEDLQFTILLYSHDSVFADRRASAAFDNFNVVTGALKGEACPYAA